MFKFVSFAGVLLLAAAALAAPTPEQKCQGGQAEAAARYGLCRAKADKKLAASGDNAAHAEAIGKCNAKLVTAWQKLEDKAADAGASCPGTVIESEIQGFVSACSDAVNTAVGGGPLLTDVATCNTELAAAELCGNGAIDAGEDCDLGTLAGASCASEGFAGGLLACGGGCVYDTSGCYAARFIDNADGTISDNETGLMWQKKVKLDSTPEGANLQDADNYYRWSGTCSVGGAYCQPNAASVAACLASVQGDPYGCSQCVSGTCTVNGGLGITAWQWLVALNTAAYAGHSDWRLPTKAELSSLIDEGQVTFTPPLIDAAFNGASCGSACTDVTSAACSCTKSNSYWSASTYAAHSDDAWDVNFGDGAVIADVKTAFAYVRAVRGGS